MESRGCPATSCRASTLRSRPYCSRPSSATRAIVTRRPPSCSMIGAIHRQCHPAIRLRAPANGEDAAAFPAAMPCRCWSSPSWAHWQRSSGPPADIHRRAARPRRSGRDDMEQSLNLAWVLIAGFLVMFMQVGFAMVETGFTRAKNAVNTMGMNLIIYPIGVLGFWLCGYGLMTGGVPAWPSLGEPLRGASELGLTLGGHHLGL